MTEVPNTILWIGAIALIVQTVLIAGLVVSFLILVGKVSQLVGKVNEMTESVKEATKSVAGTVSSVSSAAASPLVNLAGVVSGWLRRKR